MDRVELKSMLRQPTEAAARQPGCPVDDELASFMDGGLSEQEHENLMMHLADCAFCLERVGMLSRARDADSPARVPKLLVVRSRKLAAPRQTAAARKVSRGVAAQWAAAAAVVLAIGLVASQAPVPAPQSTPAGQQVTDYRQTRNIDPNALGPAILSPHEGATISSRTGLFRWSTVPDSLYYEIRIVSDEGDLVWQERVEGTQWKLQPGLALAPGAEYFVRVDAYLTESKALNSDFVPFTAGEAR